MVEPANEYPEDKLLHRVQRAPGRECLKTLGYRDLILGAFDGIEARTLIQPSWFNLQSCILSKFSSYTEPELQCQK